MTGSTWTWNGTTNNPGTAGNWQLNSGPGTGGKPQSGDTVIFNGGTTVPPDFNDSIINSGTFILTGNALVDVSNDTTSAGSSGIDSLSTIDATGTATTLAITGPFTNSGTIEVTGSGNNLAITVGAGSAAPGTLVNNGTILVTSGDTLSISGGTLLDPGAVDVNGIAVITGTLSGLGNYAIGGGGTLELNQSGTSGLTEISFTGTTGLLKLDNPSAFDGGISGFALGDTIDLGNTTITSVVFDGQGDIIALHNTTTVFVAQSGNSGALGGNGNSGTFAVTGTGGVAGSVQVTESGGDTTITGLAPSTWQWVNNTGTWQLNSGPGNGFNQPQNGDTAIIPGGTVNVGNQPQLIGNTIEIGGTAGVAAFIGTGDTSASSQNPTLDSNSVITSSVPGNSTAEASLLGAQGIWINEGSIAANGPLGSTFTLAVSSGTVNGTLQPGYFINYNQIEIDAGNTMTISVAGTSEFFNASEISVNGGTLIVNAATDAIAGGYAPVMGAVVITGGGLVATNVGYASSLIGTDGFTPYYAFGDTTAGNTLKIENIGSFGGRILGFGAGDTIDLGTLVSVGTIAYSSTTGILSIENAGGTVQDSLSFATGNFLNGTTAVSGGVAGSFTVGTGTDGDTILTTTVQNDTFSNNSGSWQTAGLWSNGVPGSLDTAFIGLGSHNAFTLTTGGSPVSVGALVLASDKQLVQVTSNTTVTPYPISDFAGTLEITSGNTLLGSAIVESGGTTVVDPSALIDLTGRAGYANIGAVGGVISIASGVTTAIADTGGTLLVNGGTINAGIGQSGGTGGDIFVGSDGGGTPAVLTVQNSGTAAAVVKDTDTFVGSDPTSFGVLTLNGNVAWTDQVDPSSGTVTTGAMFVGYNNQAANTPNGVAQPPLAGTATLLVENGATLNELSGALIGYSLDSAGSVTVESGGALWNINASSTGSLGVGVAGTGSLTVLSGGTVAVGSKGIAVGISAGSVGSLTVEGATALLTSKGALSIGSAGAGSLHILNGGSVQLSAGGLSVGASAGSSGSILLSGTDPNTGASSVLTIGTTGNGMSVGIGTATTATVDIESGGTFLLNGTKGLGIGTLGATGLVIVNGPGALLQEGSLGAGGGIGVSGSGTVVGTGTLLVENSGTALFKMTGTAAGIGVGQTAGATGLIVVTGANSLLNYTDSASGLFVGQSGQGTLDVLSGGTVIDSATLVIGSNTGTNAPGSGTVLVTGIGSEISLTGTGALSVGAPGNGVLTIGAGGLVSSNSGIFIASGNTVTSSGTVNVSSGGTLTDAASLTIGSNGSGTLAVFGGGLVQATGTSGFTVGGFSAGASGLLVINGGTVANTGTSFSVGATNATGSLLVEGGGLLNTTLVTAGTFIPQANINAGGTGHATAVISGGTWLVSGGQISVGTNGLLDINSNGLVNAGTNSVNVVTQSGGTPTLSVEGGGTLLAGGLNVANFGTGSPAGAVVVGNGGIVTVGNLSESFGGTVTVGGSTASAVLTDTSNLTIGQFGTGALLTINQFGTVLNTGTSGASIGSSGTFGTTVFNGIGTLALHGGTLDTPSLNINNGLLLVQGSGLVSSLGTAVNVGVGGFNAGGNGSIVVNGGTLSEATSNFSIGGSNIVGSLLVEGGGLLASTLVSAGTIFSQIEISAAGTGVASAVVSGGTWTISGGQLNIGNGGTGALDINSSGLVNAGSNSVDVGNNAGDAGTLSLESGGTLLAGQLSVDNDFTSAATGTLSVAGGTVVVSGLSARANGVINISSGSLSAGSIQIGNASGTGVATLTINGGQVSDSGQLSVGNGGTAILTVGTGGTLTQSGTNTGFAPFSIGSSIGGTGEVIVNGGEIVTQGSNSMSVGNGGNGTLLIEGGGTVITGFTGFGPGVDINAFGTAQASATVTGAGSNWIVNEGSQQFVVGDNGNGSLTVSAGAVVNTGTGSSFDIGNQNGGNGTVVVGGGGALLEAGNLDIATPATGTATGLLSIGSGGTVQVSTAVVGNGGGIVLAGGVLDPLGVTVDAGGSISGYGTLVANVANAGTITASGGSLSVVGGLTNTGALIIASGGALTDSGPMVNSANVSGELSLAASASLTNAAGGIVTNTSGIAIYASATSSGVSVINAGRIAGGGTSGFGVELRAGGYVSNAGSASIYSAQQSGIYIVGGAGTVRNAGSIMAAGTTDSRGIALFAGGYVSNASGGTISTSGSANLNNAIYVVGAAGTVVNAGVIASPLATAINLIDGGSVTNLSSGTIASTSAVGIYINGAIGTVVNAGLISATGTHSAVDFLKGGYLSNASTGTITTNIDAIYATGAATTVVNAGQISSNGTHSTVVLEDGGRVTNQSGGTITAGPGHDAVFVSGAAGTVVNAGLLSAAGAYAVSLATGFTNRLVVDSTAAFTGNVNGGNAVNSGVVSTLELAAGTGTLAGVGTQFINFGSIVFDTGSDWFLGGNTSGLAGTISGFGIGDTIDLTGITVTGSSYAGGVLTLDEASGSATLDLPGTFSTSSFIVNNVGGDAEITVACFAAGTRIRTTRGDVAVEKLEDGDILPTGIDGSEQPVIWIGHRTVDCTSHPKPQTVWPVRISAGAFGPGLPARELVLSPDHAVYVNEVLVPVKHLVNGSTIVQQPVDRVTYYHVELPQHDVLFAEGLPAESYLDVGDRANFANGGPVVRLHIDLAHHWEAEGCAPLVIAGPELVAAKSVVATAARHAA